MVWGYVVGGTLVNGTTQQWTLNTKKYCTIHNTDTVAYATQRGAKKHYANVKTEQTLSTSQPRN